MSYADNIPEIPETFMGSWEKVEFYTRWAERHYARGEWAEARTAALIAANWIAIWEARP